MGEIPSPSVIRALKSATRLVGKKLTAKRGNRCNAIRLYHSLSFRLVRRTCALSIGLGLQCIDIIISTVSLSVACVAKLLRKCLSFQYAYMVSLFSEVWICRVNFRRLPPLLYDTKAHTRFLLRVMRWSFRELQLLCVIKVGLMRNLCKWKVSVAASKNDSVARQSLHSAAYS